MGSADGRGAESQLDGAKARVCASAAKVVGAYLLFACCCAGCRVRCDVVNVFNL